MVEGSSAYLAGLQPGDQVVDIEGQDVTNLSTPALIALAQTLKTVPPSIGVVSRLKQARLITDPLRWNMHQSKIKRALLFPRLTSTPGRTVASASPSSVTAP